MRSRDPVFDLGQGQKGMLLVVGQLGPGTNRVLHVDEGFEILRGSQSDEGFIGVEDFLRLAWGHHAPASHSFSFRFTILKSVSAW